MMGLLMMAMMTPAMLSTSGVTSGVTLLVHLTL